MIYINGDGLWFRCSCMERGERMANTVTLEELQELIHQHGEHQ